MTEAAMIIGAGSSPRLRGTQDLANLQWSVSRFIPAPAGNTKFVGGHAGYVPVHPRACGEHAKRQVQRRDGAGSSPRLRGTQGTNGRAEGRRRFIPAPAGNTPTPPCSALPRAVHPRACGEHGISMGSAWSRFGSSPRLRGTLLRAFLESVPARFIPAPAGNTLYGDESPASMAVHPRACGEHFCTLFSAFLSRGSSPRLRGTHRRVGAAGNLIRFIPAPAGNTCRGGATNSRSAVHPRACGEHTYTASTSDTGCGSSPRLRGTHRVEHREYAMARFIPAPAGNTIYQSKRPPQQAVHPRACGEHSAVRSRAVRGCGSSPRLRGTLEISAPMRK